MFSTDQDGLKRPTKLHCATTTVCMCCNFPHMLARDVCSLGRVQLPLAAGVNKCAASHQHSDPLQNHTKSHTDVIVYTFRLLRSCIPNSAPLLRNVKFTARSFCLASTLQVIHRHFGLTLSLHPYQSRLKQIFDTMRQVARTTALAGLFTVLALLASYPAPSAAHGSLSLPAPRNVLAPINGETWWREHGNGVGTALTGPKPPSGPGALLA